jgi:hypothetical protein
MSNDGPPKKKMKTGTRENFLDKEELILEYLKIYDFDKALDLLTEYPSVLNLEILDILLKERRDNPRIDIEEIIFISIINGRLDIVDKLLQDPRVDPKEIINKAIIFDRLRIIDRLLQDPRVDPNAILEVAIENGSVKVIDRLLRDPRIRINDDDDDDNDDDTVENVDIVRHILTSVKGIPIIESLLNNPRIDPSELLGKVVDLYDDFDVFNAEDEEEDEYRIKVFRMIERVLQDSRVKISRTTWMTAVINGHLEIIDKLLQYPIENFPLSFIIQNEEAIVDRILQDPRTIITAGYLYSTISSKKNVIFNKLIKDSRIFPLIKFEDIIESGTPEMLDILVQDPRFNPIDIDIENITEIIENLFDENAEVDVDDDETLEEKRADFYNKLKVLIKYPIVEHLVDTISRHLNFYDMLPDDIEQQIQVIKNANQKRLLQLYHTRINPDIIRADIGSFLGPRFGKSRRKSKRNRKSKRKSRKLF